MRPNSPDTKTSPFRWLVVISLFALGFALLMTAGPSPGARAIAFDDPPTNWLALAVPPPGGAFAGDGLGMGEEPVAAAPAGGNPEFPPNAVTVIPCPGPPGGSPPGRPSFVPHDSMFKVWSEYGGCTLVKTGTTYTITDMGSTSAVFTTEVEGGQPCGGGGGTCGDGGGGEGGGGGCDDCGSGGGPSGPAVLVHSALVRIPLGKAFDVLSAGVLRLELEDDTNGLANPALLKYDAWSYDGEQGTRPVAANSAPTPRALSLPSRAMRWAGPPKSSAARTTKPTLPRPLITPPRWRRR